MPNVNLKPCPFCGRDGASLSTVLSYRSIYTINCGYCCTHTADHKRPKEAIDAWNMRMPEEEEKASGDELKSCPFCGGNAELSLGGHDTCSDHVFIATIKCQVCHAYTRKILSISEPNVEDEDLEDAQNTLRGLAVRFWNRVGDRKRDMAEYEALLRRRHRRLNNAT